ncbi:hypothetical protein CA850_06000 [Micromonospora echinospora]|uniref:Uncharacterized protein n=1 Tax=Micromonospora echinospora TaxID=1877 RepID=A0A1C4V3J4_MICEC|nr:hypothetical protein [Micromonospora echinospora]OZV83057.1 hypothetical protein CA850_06000 [Micromonospora echinospora]SCE78513.1 hypothetical protein GA0070618_0911 [Micromonospora echinospora]
MTWRETYWHDAASDPAYFAAVEFATVLDGDYGTRMFGRWIDERYPDSQEYIRAVEYLLVTNAYGDNVAETLETFHRQIARPWEERAMLTALERTSARFGNVPTQVRDDLDFTVLTDALTADPDTFRLWREELQESSVSVLRDGGLLDAFLDDCLHLAHEAKTYQAELEQEEQGKGKERVDEPDESSEDEEDGVTVVRKRGVQFSEPADVAAERYPWLSHSFRLGVAFTINPEANAFLPEQMSWDEAQAHLGSWGVDLGEFVEHMDEAMAARPVKAYRDERITINVMGTSVHVEVTIDSALNAHNTGIIATLDTDGAYTHYVQYKDLVMFYVDENDMNTPIYNVLKTFGDLWVGGDAESYVVRHGKGRKAHFTVTPVRASHQGSLVAVVRRCSDGMTVKVLD